METIRAIGVLFAVAFGLWGIPGVWEHWSRARRLSARIERQGKVADRVESVGVKRIIEADNERAAKELASIMRLPMPWPVVAHAILGFSLYLTMFVVLGLMANLLGTSTVGLPALTLIVGIVITGYAGFSIGILRDSRRELHAERQRFIESGLSSHFVPTPTRFTPGFRTSMRLLAIMLTEWVTYPITVCKRLTVNPWQRRGEDKGASDSLSPSNKDELDLA